MQATGPGDPTKMPNIKGSWYWILMTKIYLVQHYNKFDNVNGYWMDIHLLRVHNREQTR